MKIKCIETINFRNLKSGYPYRFNGSDFVIIQGLNEAGKSSILEAIEAGLFAKVDKYKEPDFMTWGKVEKPVIKLLIEQDGKEILIERNFQDGKSYMAGDGIDLKDDKRIRGKIEEILGFHDPDTFRNLLTIRQNEMINIEPDNIQKEMDIIMTGGREGNSVSEILSILNEKLSVRRDRFLGDDWKAYERILKEIDRLNIDKERLLENIKNSEVKRQKLSEIREQLGIDIKDIESKQKLYQWLDVFIPYREAIETTEALRDINAVIQVIRRDIEEIEKTVLGRREKLKIYRKFKEKQNDYRLRERELSVISDKLKTITEKTKLIDEINTHLKDKEVPSREELNKFKELTIKIQQGEATLKSQTIILDIEALSDIKVIVSDAGNSLKKGQNLRHEVKDYREKFSIRDVANITITNSGLSTTSENLGRHKQELDKMINKFSTSFLEELEERNLINAKREQLSNEIKKLLLNSSPEDIKSSADILNTEIKDIKAVMDQLAGELGDTKSLDVEEAILDEEEKRLSGKRKELEVLEIKKAKLAGNKHEDKLHNERISLELNLTKMEITDSSKESFIGLSLSDLKEKKDEIRHLLEGITKRVNDNRIQQAALEAELKNTPTYEEFVSVQEKVAELERLREKADIFLKSLIILEDNLRESSEKTREFIKTKTNELSSNYFRTLTCGKYDGVEVFWGNEISIKVKESGTDTFREIDNNRSLSRGAVQQLYFAIRLSLIKILTGDRKLPLILDDPFVDFDSYRLKEAMAIIKMLLTEGFQCLFFTCHDRITEDSGIVLRI